MGELEQHQWRFDGILPDVPTARTLRKALAELVAVTGLHTICKPVVAVRNPRWDAFVMIAESHISLSGIGKRAWCSVFSCRAFDVEMMADILRRLLGGTWDVWRVERGG